MPDLRPLDLNAPCPKCGQGPDAVALYYCNDPSRRGACAHLPSGTEHMHRSCKRCHFEWLEAPLTTTEVGAVKESTTTEKRKLREPQKWDEV